VHSEIKNRPKAFQGTDVLLCLTDSRLSDGTFTASSVSAASYRTTFIDLFYDGTKHTINYVDENKLNALHA